MYIIVFSWPHAHSGLNNVKMLTIIISGNPPSCKEWSRQCGLYILVMIVEKFLMTLLVLFDFWRDVSLLSCTPFYLTSVYYGLYGYCGFYRYVWFYGSGDFTDIPNFTDNFTYFMDILDFTDTSNSGGGHDWKWNKFKVSKWPLGISPIPKDECWILCIGKGNSWTKHGNESLSWTVQSMLCNLPNNIGYMIGTRNSHCLAN